MSETTNCPKCGSDDFHWRTWSVCFDCDSCGEVFSPTELLRQLAAVTAERDELRRVVERLPKTKDGVPVVPAPYGEAVAFCPNSHALETPDIGWEDGKAFCSGDGCFIECGPNHEPYGPETYNIAECYSTRAAAEAAKAEGGAE